MGFLEPAEFQEPGDDPCYARIPQEDLRERQQRYNGQEQRIINAPHDVSILVHILLSVFSILLLQCVPNVQTVYLARVCANGYGSDLQVQSYCRPH